MRNRVIREKINGYTRVAEARRAGLYPYFRASASAQDTEVVLHNGRRVLMLGCNSYLGLTNHPEIKRAAMQAIEKYGTGCAGSRVLNGSLDIHEELEERLAAWTGKEKAQLYTTGFQVNQGVIVPLIGRHDHIFVDACDHASIFEGAHLSAAHLHRFRHNDMTSLREHLGQADSKGKLIVVDGVFSMEGDIVDLSGVVDLADEFDAAVMLDDAHGIGVLGPGGRGTAAHFGLTERVDIIMGTFSKSLASVGGFFAADAQTVEYIKHFSRALLFSASMPPASAAAVLAALRIIEREPERFEAMWRNTKQMRDGLTSLGVRTGEPGTPIIPVYLDSEDRLLRMTMRLEEEGIFVNPAMPPAVPPNCYILRISLMATHTGSQIERALEVLARVGRELGVLP